MLCQAIEIADDEALATIVRRQAADLDRLAARLVDAAVEVSALRDRVHELEQAAVNRNRRIAELVARVEALS